VESRWLQRLYEYVKELFSQTWLPSHDHTHHLRVWTLAKKLVTILQLQGYHFSKRKLEQLIIAVFFHDTGLTRTMDASHGIESRELCRKYLTGQSTLSGTSLDKILDAVEKHDDKTYEDPALVAKNTQDNLLTLLAVCDDLDAYGAIGVFRYLEIYVHRGIPLQQIAVKTIENLRKRFQYLIQQYGEMKEFMQEQEKRWQYTVDFYNELDRQCSAHDFHASEGPLKVADLLIKKVIRERIHIAEIASVVEDLSLDEFSRDYFRQLQSELENP